jgi:hypothetical protein
VKDQPPDNLSRFLDDAARGRSDALFDLLTRGSHLPGTRMNAALAENFAQLCRSRGKDGEKVALAMAALSPEQAPGATAREFLPVCGVLAVAACAAADAGRRGVLLGTLHASADDVRFRVRDAVVTGLSHLGGVVGDAIVGEVAPWMDGYFHAAAVVRALGGEWLTSLHDAAEVIARLDDAFVLLRDAPRAAARWPGHKALLEALAESLPLFAVRFGVPVFDMLARWAEVKDPVLRELVRKAVSSNKITSRFGSDVTRVTKALDATEPPTRNPDHDFGPTRRRGKGRHKGR